MKVLVYPLVPCASLCGCSVPLQRPDGTRIADATTWQKQRRREILRLFEEHVYGRSPKPPRPIQFELISLDPQALGGKATRKEVTVFLLGRKDGPKMDLLATEAWRGCQASRWQVEMVPERGYALATVYYGDLEPDFSEGWKLGTGCSANRRFG